MQPLKSDETLKRSTSPEPSIQEAPTLLGQEGVETSHVGFSLKVQRLGHCLLFPIHFLVSGLWESLCAVSGSVCDFLVVSLSDDAQTSREGLGLSLEKVTDNQKVCAPTKQSGFCMKDLVLPLAERVSKAFWGVAWFMYRSSEAMDLATLQKDQEVSSPKCYDTKLHGLVDDLRGHLQEWEKVAVTESEVPVNKALESEDPSVEISEEESSNKKMPKLSLGTVSALCHEVVSLGECLDQEWEKVADGLLSLVLELNEEIQRVFDHTFPGHNVLNADGTFRLDNDDAWIRSGGFTKDEFITLRDSLRGCLSATNQLRQHVLTLSNTRDKVPTTEDAQVALKAWLREGPRAGLWFAKRHSEKARDVPRIWLSSSSGQTQGSEGELPFEGESQKHIASCADELVAASAYMLNPEDFKKTNPEKFAAIDSDYSGVKSKRFILFLNLLNHKMTEQVDAAASLSLVITHLCSEGRLQDALLCLRAAMEINDTQTENPLRGASGVSGIVLGWEVFFISYMSVGATVTNSNGQLEVEGLDLGLLPDLYQEYVTFVCSAGKAKSTEPEQPFDMWGVWRRVTRKAQAVVHKAQDFFAEILRQGQEGDRLDMMPLETLFGGARDVHKAKVDRVALSMQKTAEEFQDHLISIRECARGLQKKLGVTTWDPYLQVAQRVSVTPLQQHELKRKKELYAFASGDNINPVLAILQKVPQFAKKSLAWSLLDHPQHVLQNVLQVLYQRFVKEIWAPQFSSQDS